MKIILKVCSLIHLQFFNIFNYDISIEHRLHKKRDVPLRETSRGALKPPIVSPRSPPRRLFTPCLWTTFTLAYVNYFCGAVLGFYVLFYGRMVCFRVAVVIHGVAFYSCNYGGSILCFVWGNAIRSSLWRRAFLFICRTRSLHGILRQS